MALEKVKEYFAKFGMEDQVLEFETSSATVELAAQAVGCEPARIAKSMSFEKGDGAVLVVTAGDTKIDNSKFKHFFGMKAKMLSPDEVTARIGHSIGGVCPFAINENVEVFLDESLKRFDFVYPACGSGNSAIKLSCDQLEKYSCGNPHWADVCKIREE